MKQFIEWLRNISFIEAMIIIAIIGIILATVFGAMATSKPEIVMQEGNCVVKSKLDRGSRVYITVCNGVITGVSSRN